MSTKPEIEFQEGPAPAELAVKDIVVGEGPEATPGAKVEVHYVGVDFDSGEEFDSSWSRGESIAFPLQGLIAGWQEGIPGMRVGGRRQLTIPPELAYGPAGGGHQLSGKTLVFVIDLLDVVVPPEPPVIAPSEGPAPAELVIEDITVGEGAEAQPGGIVDVHYHGVEYETNEVFDSSFLRGDSVKFPLNRLIPGWQEGIPGMKVGGRRKLTVPPELAYGPAGGGHQLSGKTLVFVIELLDTN
ncbi:peptidylprolyl isomerase [Rhodococcus xishaensis]|uniref:Peptidyl-prolyl cis-trans isomerase n=1 Tax=Rhodococcus xishaensis TaxID=2487364 RepID=A0A3S3CM20_9NOCA|nr:peptidylprolyl isomerase [Rhodococcus xishaensis]